VTEDASTFQLQIDKIFEKFDKKEEDLDAVMKEGTDTINALMVRFRDDKGKEQDIFSEPEAFLKEFDKFSRVMGHCYHTVLEIELQRQRIRQPFQFMEEKQKLQNELEQSQRTAPLVVQTAKEPNESHSPGLFGYLSTRFKFGKLKEMVEGSKTPIITSEQKPQDILDYCRDVIRESNKFYDNYDQSLCHLHFYHDDQTKGMLRRDIRTFIGKLCNIVSGFTQAIVDYRKELIGEREVAYAQAITTLEQARIMAAAGMKASGPAPGDDLTTLLKENLRRRQ